MRPRRQPLIRPKIVGDSILKRYRLAFIVLGAVAIAALVVAINVANAEHERMVDGVKAAAELKRKIERARAAAGQASLDYVNGQ